MADFSEHDPVLEASLWRLYRDFFAQSERRRRWSLEKDVAWAECNRNLDPEIGDVVESFCAVELYLPDYLRQAAPRSRRDRAQTWFYAMWGYEESKHSLALGDWLLKAGMRSEEQMADLEGQVCLKEWQLPHDNHVAMIAYAMVQERSTALNYRNLRRLAQARGGDPALEQLLMLISVDEQAHHSFFMGSIRIHLAHNRDATLEQLRRAMNNFSMPSLYLLADGRQRALRIRELEIFTEDSYYQEVYLPILAALGVQRSEMRNRLPSRKSAPDVAGR